MQKLNKITLLSLLFVSAFSYAQETGPSKEVTVQSINKYMNETVGMKLYFYFLINENGNVLDENGEMLYSDVYYERIESVNFTSDKIEKKCFYSEDYGTHTDSKTYSNLNWGNITNIDTTVAIENEKKNSDISEIKISFSSKIKWILKCYAGTVNVSCDKTEYSDNLYIYIPKNRVAACYKALMHLKELCTVEDPFED